MDNHRAIYLEASSMVRAAARGAMVVRPWGYITPEGNYDFGGERGSVWLKYPATAAMVIAGLIYAGDLNYYY